MIESLILLRGILTLFIHYDIKSAKENHELNAKISNE